MLWIALLIAYDHTDQVYRCRDEIVATGQETKDHHKIYTLIRTDCRWEDFDPPYQDKYKLKWEDLGIEDTST